MRIVDPQHAHAHSEAQVLAVAEAGFDGPPFGIELDDLGRGKRSVAGGQMPSLLHAHSFHANDRADLLAGGGDFGVAQHARPPAFADPVDGEPGFAVGRAGMDVAAKADDVSKAQALQELEQLDVAEAAVGQDRHGDALRQERLQPGQAQVLEIVALVLQFVLVDGQPEERGGPSVAGDEMQRERGLVVGVEVGPVHRHDDLAPLAHHLANPRGEQVPGDHARVAQQAIDLFDRGLGEQSARLRERLPDQGNCERRPGHHPERSIGQRQHALGVQVVDKHPFQELMNEIKSLLRRSH